MYKLNEKTIKTDFKNIFDENLFYKCNTDIHCYNGTFEKGSIVKIKNVVVKERHSDFEEEYICLYDMDDIINNESPFISSDTPYDVPAGISIDNFSTIFSEETNLTNVINDCYTKREHSLDVLDIIDHIKDILLLIAILLTGTEILLSCYYFLFTNESMKIITKLIIPICILFLLILLEKIMYKILSKKIYGTYFANIKTAYDDCKRMTIRNHIDTDKTVNADIHAEISKTSKGRVWM